MFKRFQFSITEDLTQKKEIQVHAQDDSGGTGVRVDEFSASAIDRQNPSKSLAKEHTKFRMNQLQYQQLGLDEDERKAKEAEIIRRVEELQEQARKEGWEQGLKEGRESGHLEAYGKFHAEGLDRLQSFELFLTNCEVAKEEMLRANERFFLEMLAQLVKSICLREVAQDAEYVLRLSKEVIHKFGLRDHVKVLVNAKDWQTAILLKQEMESQAVGARNFQIEVSQDLEQGGVRVESEWNAVDAKLSTQIASMEELLVGKNNKESTTETL